MVSFFSLVLLRNGDSIEKCREAAALKQICKHTVFNSTHVYIYMNERTYRRRSGQEMGLTFLWSIPWNWVIIFWNQVLQCINCTQTHLFLSAKDAIREWFQLPLPAALSKHQKLPLKACQEETLNRNWNRIKTNKQTNKQSQLSQCL